MGQFDERLKEMAAREDLAVPEGFDGRLREMLDALPPQAGKKRRLGAVKGVLIAAAACVLLVGTAFAASPSLRDALAEALGGFAPYAREQEDQTYVIDGIEFKVRSVLADGFTIRAYVEARDVTGDIFSKIDDITIPGRVRGGVDVPTVNEWLAPDATESWSHGTECLSYDEQTGTALLVVSTWKAMPEDLTSAAVEIRDMISYLTGDFEQVWINKRDLAIPVDVNPVETTVLDKDAALVSGLGAEEARLSPLGLTLIFQDYEIRQTALESAGVSVELADGSIVEALRGGTCGVFLPPYDENSCRIMTWNFREPVEEALIEGIYVGEDYFPVQ